MSFRLQKSRASVGNLKMAHSLRCLPRQDANVGLSRSASIPGLGMISCLVRNRDVTSEGLLRQS